MVIFGFFWLRGSYTYKLSDLAVKIGKNMKFWPHNSQKTWKTQNFRYRNFKAKFDPLPTPTPPKFFHIFVANFISFHFRYIKSTLLNKDFCQQLLTTGGQKLTFSGFFFKIWPQNKIFAIFLHHAIKNLGINAKYWKKTFHSLTPSGEIKFSWNFNFLEFLCNLTPKKIFCHKNFYQIGFIRQ